MRVKKVIPKVGHFRPCQKLTKMAKKTQKKTVKNRKKRRLRHSKISVFPKWPFLDPPKTPLFGPFLGSKTPIFPPHCEPKVVKKVVLNREPPLGVLVQKSPFLAKIGVFGTLK